MNMRILSATENNENTAAGRLMRNIIGAFAQFENDIKGERTREGMKQAVREGRWCWNAPRGYKFSKDDLGKSIVVPTDEGVLIKEAFRLAAHKLSVKTRFIERGAA